MAATTQSSTGWRLFGVLCFVLLLSMAYNSYQHYLNLKLVGKVEYVTNNYRTVRDSVRRAPVPVRVVRVPVPSPQVIYRPASPTAAQFAALRQELTQDFAQQLRRALAPLVPRPATVSLKQRPMVLALKDTTVVRHRPGSNQLTLSTLKTGSFQDKWLSLSTIMRPGRAGRADSLEVKYQLRNEYDVKAWTRRVQKHWWLPGKRRIYVTLVSKNPNAIDYGLDSIPVREAKKPKNHKK